jgi:ribosome biogenesis protein YTM1
MDNQSFQSGSRQVQVQFVTNSPDIELPEGKRQLLVPTGKLPSQLNFLTGLTVNE